MSRKHFSILLALAVVATLAVLMLVPGKTGREPETGDVRLLPGAADWINEVSRVTVRHGEDQVTLERTGEAWRVQELQGYPADWPRVRDVLASLAEARIVERKTDNPAYYDRLGVEDPNSEDAGGALLYLEHGAESAALIVGHAASSGSGQYVRWSGEAGSLLVDQEFDLPRDAVGWARREIIDIPSADVAEVEIIHPDGDWILATKDDPADSDFTLGSLPEGREISSSWSVNSLGGALSALRMEDVQPAGPIDEESAVRFRLLTFDGTEYTVNAFADEAGRWIQARATTVSAGTDEDGSSSDERNRSTAADQFNQRASGWAFRIPDYKYDSLTKRSEALLQPLEDEAVPEDP
jgi:hypothetical protein